MTILNRTKNAFLKKQPFVVYRKPNDFFLKGIFPKDNELRFTSNYTEKGFVFAPFDVKSQAILFPLKTANFFKEKVLVKQVDVIVHKKTNISKLAKDKYLELVQKGITAIHNKEFKKVVLSRKETVTITNFNLVSSFQKLLKLYKNAFVYVWYHPKVGLWMGATPETLVDTEGTKYTTMSLAGTQSFIGTTEVTWQKKEIDEQQFVTDFIINNLKEITLNLQKSKRETVRAGNLLHLKTIIKGEFQKKSLQKIIKILHPTPAVCGVSKEKAKKFILKNENYNRKFYTGFLGELNFNYTNSSNLISTFYVNLRCMEIKKNEIILYIGCGITAASIPEKEWKETVEKSKVMKLVL